MTAVFKLVFKMSTFGLLHGQHYEPGCLQAGELNQQILKGYMYKTYSIVNKIKYNVM